MPVSRKRLARLLESLVNLDRHHVSSPDAERNGTRYDYTGRGVTDSVNDTETVSIGIRPYTFLGIDLEPGSDGQVDGECPFCGKDKFTVEIQSGLARCWSCQLNGAERGGLNPRSFINQYWRFLYDNSNTDDCEHLRASKKLLFNDSLSQWGVVVSSITGEYLVPGFDVKGHLHQLYRYATLREHTGETYNRLIPTPGIWDKGKVHGLFAQVDTIPLSTKIDTVYLCEGIWDAIALWEVLSHYKIVSRKKLVTSSLALSELSHSVVIATPGCKVFNEQWIELFSGRHLITMYDNDHPKRVGDNILEPDGMWGTKRVYISCYSSRSTRPPSGFEYLSWGKDRGNEWNYDPDLVSGTDIRDVIIKTDYEPEPGDDNLGQRSQNLLTLLPLLSEAPSDWLNKAVEEKISGKSITAKSCSNWHTLKNEWTKAILLRQELEDVLLCMLAVCISTEQQGDQLFLQVIGDAGSAKTKLCDALLVSKGCYALEHISGFHSGWKGKKSKEGKSAKGGDRDGSNERDDDKDYSLLSRIDRKTLVTPEGDTMMSSPKYQEIMSQQRRIFDGTSGASFKNMDIDRRYTGLRTPWIIAGTPELMKVDQSRLGDRFLRIIISRPDEDETDRILDHVAMSAFTSVKITTTPGPETTISYEQQKAYEYTGGYINYLRDNAENLIGAIAIDYEYMIDCMKLLGKYTAYFRARPELDMRKDSESTKELPTRLTAQFSRLSCCLCAVLGKRSLGRESLPDVIRICKKVAEDTAHGKTKQLAEVLYRTSRDKGLSMTSIHDIIGYSIEKTVRLVRFLLEIEVLESFHRSTSTRSTTYYRLTDNVTQIMREVKRLCQ